jgi:outer membrane immunogenic protein
MRSHPPAFPKEKAPPGGEAKADCGARGNRPHRLTHTSERSLIGASHMRIFPMLWQSGDSLGGRLRLKANGVNNHAGGAVMKKILLASVSLVALASAPAVAADLRRPAYTPPPPVYAFNWTGCYVGGNVGGLWLRKELTVALDGFGDSFSADASSVAGGVQGGCNYQFAGGWVVGIQGDYDWANAHLDRNGVFFTNLTESFSVKSVASVTGRIGYAWGSFLGYFKGGGAWERDDATFTFIPTGAVATASDTRNGWTIGIGGEYAFSNWITGFAEYDYYDFGTRSDTFLCGPINCFGNIDVKETKSVFKVGLNFLFGQQQRPGGYY